MLIFILFQQGEHVPLGVKVGDAVLLPEYGGTKVRILYSRLSERENNVCNFFFRLN